MNTNKTIITLLTAPVVTGAFLASAIVNPVAATNYACDDTVDLQGTVNRNVATVTNHSQNEQCEYNATFASYNSPKEPETAGWIEAQTLHDSKTVKVKAGETVTLTVKDDVPSCFVQTDLVRTDKAWEKPYYRTAMDVDVYKVKDSCASAPTPTPTSENKTESKTETKTETKTIETKVIEKLAQTGDSVAVLSFILAGLTTLGAGLYLRKAGK